MSTMSDPLHKSLLLPTPSLRLSRVKCLITLSVPSWDRPEARLAVTDNGGYVRYAPGTHGGAPGMAR